jgi:hypothetical protein
MELGPLQQLNLERSCGGREFNTLREKRITDSVYIKRIPLPKEPISLKMHLSKAMPLNDYMFHRFSNLHEYCWVIAE